jgi:hypothetical protein
MANMHVLNPGSGGRGYRVVCHIPVPGGSNAAGVLWANAIKNSKCCGTGTTVMTEGDGTNGTISTAEKQAIEAGSLVEEVAEIDIGSYKGMSGPQRNQALDLLFAEMQARVQARLQDHLNFFGFTRG